jgi:hypothetical protein
MVAATKADRDAALALNRRLRRDGYPSEIVQKDNYFVVQVTNLAGEAEARALMSALRDVPGVELPTVHEGKMKICRARQGGCPISEPNPGRRCHSCCHADA